MKDKNIKLGNGQYNKMPTLHKTEKEKYKHNDEADYMIISMFENMLDRYNSTVRDKAGFSFNQSILVNTINAYLMSKYLDGAKNKTRHFFNEMRKAKQDFERKTHIKFEEIRVNINDEAYNYLLQAAKTEFADDMNIEEYQEAWTESMARFGTVVEKLVHKGKGKNIVEVVPFETFLCDPVNGENLPAGQVTQLTIHQLESNKKYDQDVVKKIKAHLINGTNSDLEPHKTTVSRYEIHGNMPNEFFEKEKDGYTNGMFIVIVTEDNEKFVIYKGRKSEITYSINKINPIFGRTMGYGPMEAMLEYQIMTNKLGNMGMDNLEASRLFYQTSDSELDGQDLQEIDHLTLISHEEGSPITQVSSSPQAFGAIQSFLSNVTSMGRESASIQDASLGRGPKSNTSFAAIQANAKEADGVYTSIRDKFFTLKRPSFKRKGGFIDMFMDYFSSGKAISDLLTPYEQLGFSKFIARKEAAIEVERQLSEFGDISLVDSVDDLIQFFLKKNKGKTISIAFKGGEIDKDFIRDKTRLTYSQDNDIINKRIGTLQVLLDRVERNPQAYPDFNVNDILMEIMELTDLATANNITTGGLAQQSGQISTTPSGPQVASEAGLI